MASAGEDNCLTGRMRHCLGRLPDLERGVTRMLHRTASPSELLQTLKAFSTLAADLGVQVFTLQSKHARTTLRFESMNQGSTTLLPLAD